MIEQSSIFEDLLVRFIINLPQIQLKSNRLWSHVQLALWYYIDYIQKSSNTAIDSQLQLIKFTKKLIKTCPQFFQSINIKTNDLLAQLKFNNAKIPAFGAILLNQQRTHVLMVDHVQFKNQYSFPKGKCNQGEDGTQCAIRQVWQQVSYNIKQKINTLDCIIIHHKQKRTKYFIIKDVQSKYPFRTNTKGQIHSIHWLPIQQIKQYKVSNLVYNKLIKWLEKQKQQKLKSIKNQWVPLKLAKNPWNQFTIDRKLINFFK